MSTATPATFTTKLKQFSGTGFPAWGAQVKLVLEIKGLWDSVQEPTPTDVELKIEREAAAAAAAGTSPASGTLTVRPIHDRWMKQEMASSIILSALNKSLAAEVYLLDHPLTMLRHLRMAYNVKCSASVGAAKCEYMALYLDGEESMVDHIKNTRRVLDELQEQHVVVADDEKRQNFMQSLGPVWNGFVGVLESCATFELLIQRCQAEAIRREQQKGRHAPKSNGKTTAAFTAEQKAGQRNGSKSKKKRDMSKVKCYNCQAMGHFARDCPHERVPATSRSEAASMAFTVEDAAEGSKREWIVDSGATSHMTGHLDNLVDVRELGEPRMLTVASGDNLVATALGSAPLTLQGQEVCVLQNVLYVKGLARNLVSVAAASRHGMTVVFKDVSCEIRAPDGTALYASRRNTPMYVVDAVSKAIVDAAIMTSEAPHIETWHRRLGHLNTQSVHQLLAELQLPWQGTMNQSCPTCVSGKLTQKPFAAKEKRQLKKNQLLLAIDYVGPMQAMSREGYTGMANIVAEPFHIEMVYPLREKSSRAQLDAVKECITKLKAFAPSYRVAFIKSDNAAEYVGGEFASYCEQHEIVHEFSTPYSPQQNGKVERGNRVIVEMARSMMLGANLPLSYWADAVVCAAYVRNRCPTKVLDGKTPMEALLGKSPDINNIRVFGCKVQALVPKEHCRKLDAKTRNGIFVGYATGGAYLVHIPNNGLGETITTQTVVFYEDQFLPANDGEEVTIDSQLVCPQLDLIDRTVHQLRLDSVEEEKEDAKMPPAESETPAQQPTMSEPVGVARPQERPRGDPRQEKATQPSRRSSRIPRPSQRRLDFDEAHLSMEEVCNMVEERARFDGNNVRDGYIYGIMTPSAVGEWALAVDPINVFEIRRSDDRHHWEQAMEDEIQSLIRNGTFVEVPLPEGRQAIKSKWVYKKKTNADGSLNKYKARIVAKGFSQRFGDDYTETFSPVVRHSTVRLVLAIVVTQRMKRLQLDIKTAFFNSSLQEEIYLEPVEGYENSDGNVWRLLRALYGLKQASRAWYENLCAFLLSCGFTQGKADTCLFVKRAGDSLTIVLVYVDDILVFSTSDADLMAFKTAIQNAYDVNHFEDVNYFLGLELQWSAGGDKVRINQHKYTTTILERFGMDKTRSASTPMEEHYRNQLFQEQELCSFKPRPALGALLYLSVLTRPDISTGVRLLAQETEKPTAAVKIGVERVFRYLNGTRDFGLEFDGNIAGHDGLTVYCDAAFAVERERKSATGFAIYYNGNLVEWGSKKQSMVTLSITESEYIAMATAVQECIGLKMVLKDIGVSTGEIVVMEDNQGAQHLAENKGVTPRSRHIDTKYHWLREKVAQKDVRVQYCPTNEMLADHFTKALGMTKFERFRNGLGIRRVGVLNAGDESGNQHGD